MRVAQALICFFLSALLDGPAAGVNADVSVYTRAEGENITVDKCSSSSSGSWKIFCKQTCDRGNVLIETAENRAQTDRYSLTYEDGSAGRLSVSISQLTKSDSGLYSCGLGSSSPPASVVEFEIIVVDALLNRHHVASAEKPLSATPGADLTVACFFTSPGQSFFFCKDECKDQDILAETSGVRETRGRFSIRYSAIYSGGILYVSIRQLIGSDSGWYRCGLKISFAQSSHRDFRVVVTDATPTTKPDPTLQPHFTTVPENPEPPTRPQNETKRATERPQSKTLTGGDLLCVGLTLAVSVVLLSLAVLILWIRRKSEPSGLSSRQASDDTMVEFPVYENQRPVFTSDESMYQSLDPATKDQNQVYSTLPETAANMKRSDFTPGFYR
ncbi:hypothetical protein Q5P01_007184 [Channa striata]|uniref:Immunoglobulin domain-containing protein n=1 Tax=Channa striata TaxID=64152 RepID=A0AA88N488_CHASR|nr:hypothetical protein Q5P01_007184 [Channa striata]